MKDIMKQNTEQLKKAFEDLVRHKVEKGMVWNNYDPAYAANPYEIWNFFLPHLISSQPMSTKPSDSGHSQKDVNKTEQLRKIEEIIKILDKYIAGDLSDDHVLAIAKEITDYITKTTPTHDEIKREAEYRTTYAPILEKSAVHRFIEDLDDRTIYDKEELLGIWAESYLTQSKEGGE